MAYKYRRGPNDFYFIAPANDIRETQYGNAQGGHIFYPGVSTCTTVTLLLADNSAIGMHLAKLDLATDVDAIVNQLNVVRAGIAVTSMYAVGVLRCRVSDGWMGEVRYKWPVQLNTFNTAFGRNAGAAVTGYIQPEDTDMDYRAVIGAAGSGISWFTRPKGSAGWTSLNLSTL